MTTTTGPRGDFEHPPRRAIEADDAALDIFPPVEGGPAPEPLDRTGAGFDPDVKRNTR